MPPRIPNRKPETTTQDYASLTARHAAAKAALDAHARQRAGTQRAGEFSPREHELKIDLAEAALALEQEAKSYNRVASDLEAIRTYALAELAEYRAVLEAPMPAPPALLADATPEAMSAYVDAILAFRIVDEAARAALAPASTRIHFVYEAIRQAQKITWEARKAAHLPAPKAVIDRPQGAPGSIREIEKDVEFIEAQRVPPPGYNKSSAERTLETLRDDLAEWRENQEAEAEADRIAALPPRERALAIEELRYAAEGPKGAPLL